jgi:DNA-directed RNA polymerase specialized sigma24 family protein
MGHTEDTITAAGFTRLLARLDADADRAGHEYARLRCTLVKFFDWRGAASPDECADETLDRLARRLADTRVDDVAGYVHGIARLVLLERRRGPVLDPIEAYPDLAAAPDEVADRSIPADCLECCLARIDDDARRLALRYYEGDGIVKIANRRRLAAALGLSEAALRTRVRRLRDRLAQCVQACVSRRESAR